MPVDNPRIVEETDSVDEPVVSPPYNSPAVFPLRARPESKNAQVRPSPVLDPVARMRISNVAKWGLLIGFLFLLAAVACWFEAMFVAAKAASKAAGGTETNVSVWRGAKDFAVDTVAAIYAATVATAIPRLLFPRYFGKWREMVEAARDWIIVGVITGILYWLGVLILARFGQSAPVIPIRSQEDLQTQAALSLTWWLVWRLPVVLLGAAIGVFTARRLAGNQEGLLNRGAGNAFAQAAVQVLLVCLLYMPFHDGMYFLIDPVGIRDRNLAATVAPTMQMMIVGIPGVAGVLLTLYIIVWAWLADRDLAKLQRQGRTTGHVTGSEPVDLTLTVIGGRESGKTVLMAAAYYEWTLTDTGPLIIKPAESPGGNTLGGMSFNLAEVSKRLYTDYVWPLGTIVCRNLPFTLSLRNSDEKIARFNFLDYPGGAVGGNAPDQAAVEEFWERVDNTDGVVLVADMSYVRRGLRDPDWFEVMKAYKTVMQRLVARNGSKRVVPMALVLTKCDEFVDPGTGLLNEEAIMDGLKGYGYDELETIWRKLNEESGPRFVEYSVWFTSAITYSRPSLDSNGQPDLRKPFEMAPPPPPIVPTGCASPLLWISAKVMKWNVTLFRDLSGFLRGSSPKARRYTDAILEMEELAIRRAAG